MKDIPDNELPFTQWWREDGVDISLTEDYRGRTVMHRPDCRIVQRQRELGRPIFNLFGCKGMPEGVTRCDCLEK